MRDKLGLINAALAAFGATPLQGLSAETPAARAAELGYDATVQAMLGVYPWSFAKMTQKLQRLDEQPDNGYEFAFQLPANRLSLPLKVLADPRRDAPYKEWVIESGKLFADLEDLWGVFVMNVDPQDWPPVFAQAVIYALAASLVVPISGNSGGIADSMRALAFGSAAENQRGGWLGQAMQADARNQPSRTIGLDDNPLAMERM